MSKNPVFIRVEVSVPENPTPEELQELGDMELIVRQKCVLTQEVTLEHALGFFERVSDKVMKELLSEPH